VGAAPAWRQTGFLIAEDIREIKKPKIFPLQ
jgi:hypothetical protein